MNRPDSKSMKHPAWKSFFRVSFAVLLLLTLASALFTGCKKKTDAKKQENVKAWKERMGGGESRPDLILAYQAEINTKLYQEAVRRFNQENKCNVALLRVPRDMLMEPLQDAMEAGVDVPDLLELLEGTIGFFADCPIDKVGFVDLTERLKDEGYLEPEIMVQSPYALWSSRGHIFAIPKTVHPVALCYRVDLIEKLGIDVTKLKTWDDFVKEGQRITGEWEETDERLGVKKGDKRFMIEFADDSLMSLNILMEQRGCSFFNAEGDVAFDTPEAAETIAWFVRQTSGKSRIAFPAGDGINLYETMNHGRDLFFFCPDWRTKQFSFDNPKQRGNLALMPMPVWADGNGNRLPGSYRTGAWGGMGLAISKNCKNQELAWKFAKYLYTECSSEEFGYRFRETHIVPPVKRAWTVPEMNQRSDFYLTMERDEFGELNVKPIVLGQFYASMAKDPPPRYFTPYSLEAEKQLLDVYNAARAYYEKKGDDKGMEDMIRKQLKEKADLIRNRMKK